MNSSRWRSKNKNPPTFLFLDISAIKQKITIEYFKKEKQHAKPICNRNRTNM